jgi:hypothetical protein
LEATAEKKDKIYTFHESGEHPKRIAIQNFQEDNLAKSPHRFHLDMEYSNQPTTPTRKG